jgi:hypothetical protein
VVFLGQRQQAGQLRGGRLGRFQLRAFLVQIFPLGVPLERAGLRIQVDQRGADFLLVSIINEVSTLLWQDQAPAGLLRRRL